MEDGIREWALIEESKTPNRTYYYLSTYNNMEAALHQSEQTLKSLDWTPVYVIQLESGRAFPVEIAAFIGAEISLENSLDS